MKKEKRKKVHGSESGNERKAARDARKGHGGKMPDVFALCEGAFEAKGALCEKGVLLLSYRLTLPAAATSAEGLSARAAARIEGFYARIAGGMWQECEGQIFPLVRRAYEESDDPHKRFRFARYVLFHSFCTTMDTKETLIFERTLTLSRRGKLLRRAEFREVFSKKSGRLLSLRTEGLLHALRPQWKKEGKKKEG